MSNARHARSARPEWKVKRRLRAWARRHSYSLFSSLGALLRSPVGTLLTTVVLGVALFLPLGLYVTTDNLAQLDPVTEDLAAITVYMEPDVVEGRVRQLGELMQAWPEVAQTRSHSPESAMQEFKQFSGFGAALDALNENPLPWVLELILDQQQAFEKSDITGMVQRAESQSGVDFAQYDLKWLDRLQGILRLASAVVQLLFVLFGVAVIFVVGNTIRLDIENRRAEIEVMSLVGAAEPFIRRPFLYAGFWYGLLGGLLALLVLWLAAFYLSGPLERLVSAYQGDFSLKMPSAKGYGLVLLGSGVLGLLGAWVAVQKHLRTLYPS